MGDILASILFLAFVVVEAIADGQQYMFQTEKYRRKKHNEILTGEYADGFKQNLDSLLLFENQTMLQSKQYG